MNTKNCGFLVAACLAAAFSVLADETKVSRLEEATWGLAYDGYEVGVIPPSTPIRRWIAEKDIAFGRRLDAAKKAGREVVPWFDVLTLPLPVMAKFSPEMRDAKTRKPTIFRPMTREILRAQIAEFFARYPSVDGIALRTDSPARRPQDVMLGAELCGTEPERTAVVELFKEEVCRRHARKLVVGDEVFPPIRRRMNGSWCSLGTSITWYNNHVGGGGGFGCFTRGYQDRVRDHLVFDAFTNLGCNGGVVRTQLGHLAKADYYTIEHGINDWGHSVPVGTLEDYRRNTTNGTFCATYRTLIDRIRALNPKARIILCTPRRGYGFATYLPRSSEAPKNGIYLASYANAVRQIAAEEKLPVADFFDRCGTQEELAGLSIDIALHPNDAGYARMADELIRAFESIAP